MLCPTGAMTSVFSLLPSWILFPSYRSIITLLVFVIGPLISVAYITAAKFVLYVKSFFSSQSKSNINNLNKKVDWTHSWNSLFRFGNTSHDTCPKTGIFHSRILSFILLRKMQYDGILLLLDILYPLIFTVSVFKKPYFSVTVTQEFFSWTLI